MKARIAILSLAVAATFGYRTGAFAQSPAGGGEGSAATIPGSEVRAGESRRLNKDQGVTTGASTLRPIDRDTAIAPDGRRIDTNIAPGGLVGRDAPDASAAAPAGR